MINFRFHIVSLTAVLLALGVGLVLGTTFLDNATVDVLRRQLEDLEVDVDNARRRNADLEQRLGELEEEAASLDEQIGERLFDGRLEDDPVLVVAPRGIDEAWVDGLVSALDDSDADLVGVWWLAEKLRLEDEGQVAELADALALSTDDADRLRRHLAVQVADVLYGAADATPDDDADDAPPAGGPGRFAGALAQAAPAEPNVLARLREAGFVEYELAEGDESDVIRLPPSGLRVVVVSGPGSEVAPGDILHPVLVDLASDGPVPVVVSEPVREPDDDEEEDPPTPLVDSIRNDDDLAQRISTVDNLDRVSGRVAIVLAVADARPGDPAIGHYGLGDGTRLLPPPEEGG
jgi:hypothetical protein